MSSSLYGLDGYVLSWTEKALREKENALQLEHLGDHLIGLMRSDVHLDVGGRLEQFPYTG